MTLRESSNQSRAFPRDTGLDDEKEAVARSWLVDKPGYDVIVATTAFGMGIDKPNVRLAALHPKASLHSTRRMTSAPRSRRVYCAELLTA